MGMLSQNTIKKGLRILTVFGLLGIISACYVNVKTPGPNNRVVNYQLDTDDFIILGPVEAEGEITSILGLVITGGSGWNQLMGKARSMGADDIMNYHYDLQAYSILLIVYNKGNWKATATAIRYKDHVRKTTPRPAPVTKENE